MSAARIMSDHPEAVRPETRFRRKPQPNGNPSIMN
jgi:hypothetical protein